MSNFDDDEAFRKRSQAICLLEGDEDEAIVEHGEVFGEDDIDRAERVAREMPTADGLEQKVALRNDVHGDLGVVAPWARINPVSVLKGTLGGQQEVPNGENRQVALWGGDDVETLPVTVTFAPVEQIVSFTNPAVTATRRPYGIVRFGTRGFLTEAIIDIGHGVQFTVNASQVSLQVGLETRPNNSVSMKLSGMLSFYPTTHVAPVTRTIYFDGVAISTTPQVVFIPAYARGVMLLAIQPGAPATNEFTIRFLDSVGAETSDYTYPAAGAAGPVMPTSFIPIPGDAVAIQVTSSTLVPPFDVVDFRLIFELAF